MFPLFSKTFLATTLLKRSQKQEKDVLLCSCRHLYQQKLNGIKYQSTVTSTVKYRVTFQPQVTVTVTRYYFGQVPSTVPSYKKKVPSRTTAVGPRLSELQKGVKISG